MKERIEEIAKYLEDPGTLEDRDDSAAMMVEAIKFFRVATEFYNTFNEEDQKYIRHNLYRRQGRFAKTLKEEGIFDAFDVLEKP